ncbi:MAG TPA: SDR family oxidoreductase [Gemmatimonadales bacterium]|nr:SDR family oxidoreductase [Gemmatimonadales bacterium]HRZ08955.1 SDR family oxidoreductase [Gemmatimonadales bacterium]
MRLLVIGASGATGQHLVDQALQAGHAVTAFVRDPARLPLTHAALRVVAGDAMRRESLGPAVGGHDAVLCILGAKPEGVDAPRGQPGVPVCSAGTKHLIEAMTAAGVRRLVVVSSASVGESRGTGRFPAPWVLRTLLREVMDDKEIQEAAVRGSGLDWTIVRPVKMTNGPRTGRTQVGPTLRWGLGSKVSRADVAAAVLDTLSDASSIGAALTVTGA